MGVGHRSVQAVSEPAPVWMPDGRWAFQRHCLLGPQVISLPAVPPSPKSQTWRAILGPRTEVSGRSRDWSGGAGINYYIVVYQTCFVDMEKMEFSPPNLHSDKLCRSLKMRAETDSVRSRIRARASWPLSGRRDRLQHG